MAYYLSEEKNKSKFKLKGLPEIYYINLDDKVDRREYMEGQFKYWGIENYTRISAQDGRNNSLASTLVGEYPERVTHGEIGCLTSHLKALKHWLENSDEEYLLVMEDDCDLQPIKNWKFKWSDLISWFPYDFDVIQLAIINPGVLSLRLHKRFVNDFSTACYLITRHHAQKLVNLHCVGDKFKLDQGIKPRAVADDCIYNSGNTFGVPLLLYKIDMGSDIHQEHIDMFHRSSHEGLLKWWAEQAPLIEDWRMLFDYDPYYGQLPPEMKVAEEPKD